MVRKPTIPEQSEMKRRAGGLRVSDRHLGALGLRRGCQHSATLRLYSTSNV